VVSLVNISENILILKHFCISRVQYFKADLEAHKLEFRKGNNADIDEKVMIFVSPNIIVV
jgi:hypothetical protein